jgi:hypothetical protein
VSTTDTELLAQPGADSVPPHRRAEPRALSVLALVLGIVGLLSSFTGAGLVFALAAVILGHLGLRREPRAWALALMGALAGYAGLVVSVIWSVITLAAWLVPVFAVGILAGVPFIGG